MNHDEIFERLQVQMAEALEIEPSAISENMTLVEDLDADSLDLLEMILGLKDEFGISVSDGEVKQLLVELARFLPEAVSDSDELTDEELAEVSRRLTVGNIVSFIEDRVGVSAR